MFYGAHIAKAINNYAPDYGFDVEVKKFDFSKLIKSRQAYIGHIHTSYNNILAKNNIDVIGLFKCLSILILKENKAENINLIKEGA